MELIAPCRLDSSNGVFQVKMPKSRFLNPDPTDTRKNTYYFTRRYEIIISKHRNMANVYGLGLPNYS